MPVILALREFLLITLNENDIIHSLESLRFKRVELISYKCSALSDPRFHWSTLYRAGCQHRLRADVNVYIINVVIPDLIISNPQRA